MTQFKGEMSLTGSYIGTLGLQLVVPLEKVGDRGLLEEVSYWEQAF